MTDDSVVESKEELKTEPTNIKHRKAIARWILNKNLDLLMMQDGVNKMIQGDHYIYILRRINYPSAKQLGTVPEQSSLKESDTGRITESSSSSSGCGYIRYPVFENLEVKNYIKLIEDDKYIYHSSCVDVISKDHGGITTISAKSNLPWDKRLLDKLIRERRGIELLVYLLSLVLNDESGDTMLNLTRDICIARYSTVKTCSPGKVYKLIDAANSSIINVYDFDGDVIADEEEMFTITSTPLTKQLRHKNAGKFENKNFGREISRYFGADEYVQHCDGYSKDVPRDEEYGILSYCSGVMPSALYWWSTLELFFLASKRLSCQ